MVKDLIFKTPESEGLSSKFVLDFIDRMDEYKTNLHSFMIVKNGNILTEAYYKPFDKDFQHRLYSSSKTFVSIAIGKMVDNGLVKLDDRIIDYFPEFNDGTQDKWLKETTIEDALKMSVPMFTDTYFALDYQEWAWTFFCHPTASKSLKPAGTVFNYNTSGSFILDVLVEKITGKTFLEYLRPEFDKIGISKDIWCVKSPDGYAWGGSGVIATLRDFAAFGELVLNKGACNGEQLISKEYMDKATSPLICNLTENRCFIRRDYGYGYQIWVTSEGYALQGMGSQFAFCFPKKNFMFVCNGDTQSSNDNYGDVIYDAVKHILYDNIQDEPIVDDGSFNKELNEKVESLHLITDFGPNHSDFEKEIDGVKYILNENVMGWKWFRFDFDGEKGKLTYENARGIKSIGFGFGNYDIATFPETHYYDAQVGFPANRELNCMSCANWPEYKKLLLRVYITDTSMGNCFMTFGFKGDEVGVMLKKRAEFFMDDYEGYACGKRDK